MKNKEEKFMNKIKSLINTLIKDSSCIVNTVPELIELKKNLTDNNVFFVLEIVNNDDNKSSFFKIHTNTKEISKAELLIKYDNQIHRTINILNQKLNMDVFKQDFLDKIILVLDHHKQKYTITRPTNKFNIIHWNISIS